MSVSITREPLRLVQSRNLTRVVENLGPIVAWIAIIASLLTQVTASTINIGPIPAALALIALALGIPHGAADNLTLVNALSWRGWIRLGVVYVSIAAAAALLIIAFPVFGFILVIAMTVWHFGTGDVQATAELEGRAPATGKFRVIYALALGSAPVLLPLTSSAALSTVVSLEPALSVIYSTPVTAIIRGVVLTLIVISIVALISRGALRSAFELFTLAVLGLVVSPFIAFAVYFGLWHATRHTARLAQATTGAITLRSLASVTKIGIPSLIGFIAILAGVTIFLGDDSLSGAVLWIGLAIVWGLTVPHMWFVSRFDQRLRAESISIEQTPA
jgi:Brp/Blh family beta-carotene 15,15'-monooxygenase